MRFWLLLRDYASWTSMAGVARISSAPSWPVRTFWIVVWMTMFGISAYQIFLIFTKFISFPIMVSTLLQMKHQDFPTVIVCNTNPYKRNLVFKNQESSKISTLMSDFNLIKGSKNKKYHLDNEDTYGFNTVKTLFLKTERAEEALALLANQLSEHDRSNLLYPYEETIEECSFNDVPCDKSSFKMISDPIYGRCFAFNPNNTRPVSRAGMKSGLRLVLKTKNTRDDDNFLPTTQTLGFRVRISGPNEDPAMESFGIPIGTGAQTKIGLKLTEIRRMKRPYGICVNVDERVTKFYPDTKYSLDVCIRTCLQKRIIENCGCAHPRYGYPENQKTCDTDKRKHKPEPLFTMCSSVTFK
ncbi:hypothetical protein L596_027366 [Steinernema carpocapsae]|uniref:Uncharacterized protein n=1 Tax=Steinernema carpocapsae TaxID=34508 RepID=A0A4U5M445_STECR|nr:hypothetical protein L596_027366 [Steinernema carpocapsae]